MEDPDVDRSPTTIDGYKDYFLNQILPNWGQALLTDVKAVAVEKCLRSLDFANGTKAKIRNHLSALFSHCIRYELYTQLNPIASVRQSAVREAEPEVLSIEELKALLTHIKSPAIKVMVVVAANSAVSSGAISMMRHANSRITLEIYQQAVSDEKRQAQNLVVRGLFEAVSHQHPSAPSKTE